LRHEVRGRAPFRRVAIVGVGLIGGSIGLAMRRQVPRVQVVGIDRPAVLRAARLRGAVDESTPSLVRGLRGADLVLLALPVDGIMKTLPRVARLAGPRALITDVGSTKGEILGAARRLGLANRFVGGHPMAGSERSGIRSADASLFRGAPWILCPGAARGQGGPKAEALGRLASLVELLGARPARLDARRHDEAMARLSHLPQLISVALVNAAAASPAGPLLEFSGPAFRQMSRLASSPPGLWDAILRSNRSAATAALDDFIRELRRLRLRMGRGLARDFRRAARFRARLARRERSMRPSARMHR
jgi:prephenate dehydrogenase